MQWVGNNDLDMEHANGMLQAYIKGGQEGAAVACKAKRPFCRKKCIFLSEKPWFIFPGDAI